MKKILALLCPILLLGNSFQTEYGEFDFEVKSEYKSYSKSIDTQEEKSSHYFGVDFLYKKELLSDVNFLTTLHLNAPLSNTPKTAGGEFGFGKLEPKDEDPSVSLYLGQFALEYKVDDFYLQTFRHYIDTPMAKSDSKDMLKTAFEGVSVTKGFAEDYKLKFGFYSRIFGAGNSYSSKRDEFVTFSQSINQDENVSDNYFTLLGLEMEDRDAGIGGSLYYYNLLEHDVGGKSNDLSLLYLDGLYVKRIQNSYRVRKDNRIISRSDTDTLVFLGQLYQGSESIQNDFLVVGVKGIYRNSTSPVGYFVSYATVGGESGKVRYPFNTVPEYTRTGDFDFSKVNSGKYAYKLEAKYYFGKDFFSLYYAGFSGEDFGNSGVMNASIVGSEVSGEFFKSLEIGGYVESQSFEGVNNTSLKDNLAASLRIRYRY